MYKYKNLDEFIKEAFIKEAFVNRERVFAVLNPIIENIYSQIIKIVDIKADYLNNLTDEIVNEFRDIVQAAIQQVFEIERIALNKKQLSPQDKQNILSEIKQVYIQAFRERFVGEFARLQLELFIRILNALFTSGQ